MPFNCKYRRLELNHLCDCRCPGTSAGARASADTVLTTQRQPCFVWKLIISNLYFLDNMTLFNKIAWEMLVLKGSMTVKTGTSGTKKHWNATLHNITRTPTWCSFDSWYVNCNSILWKICIPAIPFVTIWHHSRADSRFAPSQWETALLCNDVSHWWGAGLESALHSTTSCEKCWGLRG